MRPIAERTTAVDPGQSHPHRGGVRHVCHGQQFEQGWRQDAGHPARARRAQLRGSTSTDEIRSAIEAHIAAVKASPDLAGRADSVLEDIEREAAARREAIATLFGSTEPDTSSGSRERGRRRGGEGSSDS
jgi:hypothetical protein